MKTFKQIIASTLLVGMIPMVTSAQQTQKLSIEQVRQKMAGKSEMMALLKQQAEGQNGMILKKAHLPALEETVQKLNGSAVIDLGKGKRFDLRVKEGGVIVGSGADSLVATSNISASGVRVITPPLQPRMSITVTGRQGEQRNNYFCIVRLNTTTDGSIKKGDGHLDYDVLRKALDLSESGDPTFASAAKSAFCQSLNLAKRVQTAGLYAIFFNGSSTIVSLNENENKVIPLREISFPKVKDKNPDGKLISVKYTVSTDGWDEYEAEKDNKLSVAAGASITGGYRQVSLTEIDMSKDTFVSVLPGGYLVSWVIDGSNDETRKIEIE